VLPEPSKATPVLYSAEEDILGRWRERAFLRSREPSPSHNIRLTENVFGGHHHCGRRLPSFQCFDRLVLRLTRVCQVAWLSGRAPTYWPTGMIISTHKKEDRKECINYPGISFLCLPVLQKITEPKLRTRSPVSS